MSEYLLHLTLFKVEIIRTKNVRRMSHITEISHLKRMLNFHSEVF